MPRATATPVTSVYTASIPSNVRLQTVRARPSANRAAHSAYSHGRKCASGVTAQAGLIR